MPIGINKVVTVNFTLKDQFGNILDSTDGDVPFSFLTGHQNIIPKLESEIDKMLIGSKKTILIDAKDAYGEYNEDIVQVVGKEEFPPEFILEVGMQYIASTSDGTKMPFTITEVGDDEVTIDFNHPLAGKDLTFEIELLNVRDATSEEISHGHVHGAGGYQH
ncbi:MAG: peptidylprolyl isomerase [Ignavibacterium sp.]|nr:peptidylprolyl isomerase [Ignavibacterium sp.]MDW8374185.1 peptidylprolyl isomerase [Ignavibacteriales bacterium]